MNETVVLAIAMVATIGGGALGAYLARASAWKGAILTLVASVVHFAAGELVPIDNAIVSSIVFLAAVGLIGGRWGMGMTGRQLSLIVIGSFLFAFAGSFAAIYLVLSPAGV